MLQGNPTHYKSNTLQIQHITNPTHYKSNTLQIQHIKNRTHYKSNTLQIQHITNPTHYKSHPKADLCDILSDCSSMIHQLEAGAFPAVYSRRDFLLTLLLTIRTTFFAKLFIMKFSPFSCYFLLGTDIFLRTSSLVSSAFQISLCDRQILTSKFLHIACECLYI
jgi:hypothetical protein